MVAVVKTGDEIARVLQTPELGDGLSAMLMATLKPTPSLTLAPRLMYGQLQRKNGEELYAGSIARLDGSYQFTPELSGRLTAQFDEFSGRFDPTGEPTAWGLSERQFFVKLQYRFDS